ncbi:hypothetical protein A2Z00_00685 [Candidatus Gottesmanbacteria bacterium RBG_13_45_10]|uniref:Transcobalamin-like C-terminal domain-containing protein n=1 Tax=Candidatus Gottesmanbacteria bacterium RBG_13_45_10 TaxID=1798370 RepID=A0A1F5ZGX6_9BACT|nr:MAG: hypothetical protein A2Z00_00685 [Candidatus Gottesmanbacteria bacterium RBG_13_45_10]
MVLDTGDKIASYDGIPAQTVFDALKEVSTQRHDTLATKQYDFGIFIEAIGEYANTKDNAWVYSVNGKSGEVAADKYVVKNGDIVEWKYTKPLY